MQKPSEIGLKHGLLIPNRQVLLRPEQPLHLRWPYRASHPLAGPVYAEPGAIASAVGISNASVRDDFHILLFSLRRLNQLHTHALIRLKHYLLLGQRRRRLDVSVPLRQLQPLLHSRELLVQACSLLQRDDLLVLLGEPLARQLPLVDEPLFSDLLD